MALSAQAIDFGYLQDLTTMVVKNTKHDPHGDGVRLVLNLKRLEMEVHFLVTIKSRGKPTERAYRFFVALDDQFSLCEIPGNGVSALIIHVKNPPWYSRQLKEAMQMSHDPKSFKWTADDTWSRQTDIVDEKETYQKIDSTPVTVQKLYNSVDIARWTTFRLTVKTNTDHHDDPLRRFLRALADFNIRVTRNSSFKVTSEQGSSAPFWTLLDGTSTRTLSEQFSLPHLDFDLRYQLEVCISKGWLNEYNLDEPFLTTLAQMPIQRAKQMLIHVDSYEQRVYDLMTIFTDLRYTRPVRVRALPSNCAEIHHATITATGVIFHTPSTEISNRIVRKYQRYSDHFLRVRFEDDSYRGRTRLYPATNGRMKLIFERVRRTMRKGIVLGDRHYEFLAWGNSQLREHGAYFFASCQNPRLTVNDIRKDMGTFDHEKVVAKRAARMGQCFSTTKPVPFLSRNSWRRDPIQDIKNGEYNFTDGVGKISPLAAQLVKTNLRLGGDYAPSTFQFRLGGCKGVLTVDPRLTGIDVQIRPSQYKFNCESDELEIIRVSEFWQPFLNRQLILVLSALGVPDAVFLQKQESCIKALDAALEDDTIALRALRETVDPNLITLNIAAMIEAGFSQANEPFVASLVRLWRAWTLKYLKEKAKIPVPQGAFLLGVVDETETLRGHINDIQPAPGASRQEKEQSLPEIFIQYTDPQQKGVRRIVEGICVIARNPSLHQGDIRVVKAINVPQLRHLCDVVVMPSTGDRDLPSMCSGGDLDGDDYIVIWDPDLIPEEWNAEPFHYNAPEPIKKDEVSIDDIINFFYDYMQNDFLGRIAHAHLAAADYLDEGINSEQCLKLVELHSMAVDYPKTGVPAEMSRDLERNNWPHFMEKKRAGTYTSRKILGRLYDAVERVNFQPHMSGTFDRRILMHAPPSDLVGPVSKLKKSYDESLRRIMAQHQIASEFEVWSTFVLDHSKAARDFKFHEEIGQHAKTLKDQYYDAFVQEAGGHDMDKLTPFAIAAYHITHNELQQALKEQQKVVEDDKDSGVSDMSTPAESELPFISFPWVLQDTLQKVARNTVLQDEAGSTQIEDEISTTGNSLTGGEVEFGLERTARKWTYNGEHLPDPYVPIAMTPDVARDETSDLASKTVSGPTPMIPPSSSSGQASLRDLPLITPISGSRLGEEERRSASIISSMASSNMPSVVLSGISSSTSPNDSAAPLCVRSRPSGTSTTTSRLSSLGSSSRGLGGVLLNSTNATQTQPETEKRSPLKDPGMMPTKQALVGDVVDDDDDYTF